MHNKYIIAATAAFTVFLSAPPAFAEQDLNNKGALEQVLSVEKGLALEQSLAIGSIQGANVIAAQGSFNNDGTTRQEVNAKDVTLRQDKTAGSLQGINVITTGNAAASFPKF